MILPLFDSYLLYIWLGTDEYIIRFEKLKTLFLKTDEFVLIVPPDKTVCVSFFENNES